MVTKHWAPLPKNRKSAVTSKNASRLREQVTKSEGIFMMKLLDAGFLNYRFQQAFYNNEIITYADFYLRKPIKLVIEIDGPYHFKARQQRRDREKDWFYIHHPKIQSVLRMTDEQAINISVEDLRKLILGLNKGGITVLYDLPKY